MRATIEVIILGAGAAGLLCAATAGRRGRSTLVLEGGGEPGRKVLISGGGRCNFTNVNAAADNYICRNPHFHKSALAGFTPHDFVRLVEKHAIRYHEKKFGQLFCDGSANQIVRMLLAECAESGARIELNRRIDAVESREGGFVVNAGRDEFACRSLVVATGGLSIPKLGATDFGYRVAQQFGVPVVAPKPGLTPLLLGAEQRSLLSPLSGISVDAEVRIGTRRFRESVLVTHRGLSGPAILQISSYRNRGDEIEIDLAPDHDLRALLASERGGRKELKTVLSQIWPARFADAWTALEGGSRPLTGYSEKELAGIAERLHHWRISPSGDEGYAKAEVTVGGVDTDELSSKTMECRRVPGLYFIGEVVDVTGQLGGFNFQWAWASAHAAGNAVK